MNWVICIGLFICVGFLWECRNLLTKIEQHIGRQTVLLEAIKAEATSNLKYYRPQAVRIVTDQTHGPFSDRDIAPESDS